MKRIYNILLLGTYILLSLLFKYFVLTKFGLTLTGRDILYYFYNIHISNGYLVFSCLTKKKKKKFRIIIYEIISCIKS